MVTLAQYVWFLHLHFEQLHSQISWEFLSTLKEMNRHCFSWISTNHTHRQTSLTRATVNYFWKFNFATNWWFVQTDVIQHFIFRWKVMLFCLKLMKIMPVLEWSCLEQVLVKKCSYFRAKESSFRSMIIIMLGVMICISPHSWANKKKEPVWQHAIEQQY